MKLLKLQITEFGGLRDTVLEPGAGLNIIEGDNESGKSTVLAFIRFMLYGLGGRAGGSEPSDKERYPSWAGGRAAGIMTLVTSDGRRWRIEREGVITHTARGDSYNEKPVRIFDDETGELVHRGQCPGELFLGLSVQNFNSTCAVAQLKNTELGAGELGNGIENMLRSADEGVSVPRVCKRLEDARRELIHKTGRGGRIYDLKCECERLGEQLERAESNARSVVELETLLCECREKTAAAAAESAKLDEIWERSEAWLVLGRFERRDEETRALAERREALAGLEASAFPGGYLPPDGYADRLAESAERLSAADAALRQAELRCEQHAALPTYDAHLADRADKMEAAGQTRAAVTEEYSRRMRLVSRRRATGTLALSGGFIALATGLALLFILKLTLPGAAVAGAGALCLILGAALLSTVGRARREVASYLSGLGLDDDPGVAGLGRYFDDCATASRGRASHESAARALDDVRKNCRRTLDGELAAARELLRPFEAEQSGADAEYGNKSAVKPGAGQGSAASGRSNATSGSFSGHSNAASDTTAAYQTSAHDESAAVCAGLRRAAADCRRFAGQRSELVRDIESRAAALERLNQSLGGYDRQFLQSKAARLDRSEVIGDEEHRRRRDECARVLREAYDNQTALERRIAFAEAQEQSPARVAAQLDAARAELSRLEHKADAMTLALEAINSASGQLRRGFTPALRAEAQKLLTVFTDGELDQIGISDDFALSAQFDGATRPAALLSGGTRDAVYLAVRFALTRLLCRDELPPLLLDESLTQLDDRRAGHVLDILGGWCRAGGQCLLFTCHGREAEMATGRGEVSVLHMPVC